MEKYVVTITRQFGSLGRPIARKMSELLGINYYDRDIVESTANHLNLPVSTISAAEDFGKSRFAFMKYPLGSGIKDIQDKIFAVQEQIIQDLADKESCIIVGRCADFALKDYKNCLNISIYAPFHARYTNCVEKLFMRPDEAREMIRSVDKARNAYHKKYAGYFPNSTEHMDLMIDSSVLGAEETAKFLAELVRKKFQKIDVVK